jgi:hypothetical protein
MDSTETPTEVPLRDPSTPFSTWCNAYDNYRGFLRVAEDVPTDAHAQCDARELATVLGMRACITQWLRVLERMVMSAATYLERVRHDTEPLIDDAFVATVTEQFQWYARHMGTLLDEQYAHMMRYLEQQGSDSPPPPPPPHMLPLLRLFARVMYEQTRCIDMTVHPTARGMLRDASTSESRHRLMREALSMVVVGIANVRLVTRTHVGCDARDGARLLRAPHDYGSAREYHTVVRALGFVESFAVGVLGEEPRRARAHDQVGVDLWASLVTGTVQVLPVVQIGDFLP